MARGAPIEKPPTVHSVGGFVICATILQTAEILQCGERADRISKL